MKTKLIPFDLAKAKAGAKIVTRGGKTARLVDCNLRNSENRNLLVVIEDDKKSYTYDYSSNGIFFDSEVNTSVNDLFIEEEVESELNKKQSTPIFRVGNWIVQQNVGVFKVTEICESWYEVIDPNDNYYSISFNKEYMCHSWTINDAKPGDILISKNGLDILIFKNSDSSETFSSYYNIKERENWYWSNCSFIPATKKQSDILFKKMEESGYQWNHKKKKLKKLKVEAPKTRRMTNQELAWWLRDHPEEHREYKYSYDNEQLGTCYCTLSYENDKAGIECDSRILIRRKGREWKEPLIKI